MCKRALGSCMRGNPLLFTHTEPSLAIEAYYRTQSVISSSGNQKNKNQFKNEPSLLKVQPDHGNPGCQSLKQLRCITTDKYDTYTYSTYVYLYINAALTNIPTYYYVHTSHLRTHGREREVLRTRIKPERLLGSAMHEREREYITHI